MKHIRFKNLLLGKLMLDQEYQSTDSTETQDPSTGLISVGRIQTALVLIIPTLIQKIKSFIVKFLGLPLVLLKQLSFISILTFIFTSLIGLVVLLGYRQKRKLKRKRRVVFIGSTKTGKTTAVLKIIQKLPFNSMVSKTDKSLVSINNLEISEVTLHDKQSLKKVKMNLVDKFIFFLKNEHETHPDLIGFDVYFVIWWKKDKMGKVDNIYYLNEDPIRLMEIIYSV